MATFEPVLSRNWNVPDSHTLKVYESQGGYQAVAEGAGERSRLGRHIVKDSELRGRGGAGFPCGLKWTLPSEGPEGNAHVRQRRRERAGDVQQPAADGEGPPPVPRGDPDRLLRDQGGDGLSSTCGSSTSRPTGSSRRRSPRPGPPGTWARTSTASGFNLDIWLHRGAGAYICGEETGLIESLEGKRGWPRIKPPFPAIEGAFRKPTVVNNVETLCCVPHIIERGADWFKSIGTPKSYGPKLYCVSGHVNKQVCVELPLGVTCRELIDEHAGGVWKGRKAKAAVPGGISMGLLSADELDTPLDFESLRKPGCLGLGTAAVTVIDDQTSIVDYLYNTCRFFAHESCGQCTPCREGTGLDVQDDQADQGRRRADRGPRHHAPDWPTTWASCPGPRSAAWPTARPGRSRTRSPSSAASSRITSDTHQSPAARVTALQEEIAHGIAAPTASVFELPVCRLSARHDRDGIGQPASDHWPLATNELASTHDGDHHHQRTEYTIPEGEKLNAIQMAKRVGIEIPYYCWHPALSVVANCRMCEIEVGSKDPKTGEIKMLPKLVPGCQTPGQGRDRARDRQPQGQGAPADGHGVPAPEPPARLPGLRPGRRVRPAGLQLPLRPGDPPLRRGADWSTRARTSRT